MKQLVEVQLKDIDLPDNAKQSGDNDWQISDQKRERLGRRFNHLVRHNDHWKEPFRAVIPALLYDEYAEAAAFFAGSIRESCVNAFCRACGSISIIRSSAWPFVPAFTTSWVAIVR